MSAANSSFSSGLRILVALCIGSCSTAENSGRDSMAGVDRIDRLCDSLPTAETTVEVVFKEQDSGVELLLEELPSAETTHGLDSVEIGCTEECGSGACGFCSDDDPETVDMCQGGTCVNTFVDCDDGNDCTLDFLNGCGCDHQLSELAHCCVGPWHCEEADYCTVADCIEFKCVWHVRKVAQCGHYCGDAAGPSPCVPSHICFVSACDETSLFCEETVKKLEQQALEGIECCAGHNDCGPGGVWEEDGDGDGSPGPDVPETVDLCVGGLCEHVLQEACNCLGTTPDECPDDGLDGTDELCVGDCLCASVRNSQWCQHDDDCWTDLPSLRGSCIDNVCQIVGQPSHECVDGSSDPFQCDDGNPCTIDWCSATEECVHSQVPTAGLEECCLIDADCSVCDDGEEYYCEEGNQCERDLGDRAP